MIMMLNGVIEKEKEDRFKTGVQEVSSAQGSQAVYRPSQRKVHFGFHSYNL